MLIRPKSDRELAGQLACLIDWLGRWRKVLSLSLFLSHIILLIHHHPSCPSPNCSHSSSLFGLVDLTASHEKRDGRSGGGCASSSLGSKCLEKSRLILLCFCTYPSPAIHGSHRRCRKHSSWSVCDLSLSFPLSDALVFCFCGERTYTGNRWWYGDGNARGRGNSATVEEGTWLVVVPQIVSFFRAPLPTQGDSSGSSSFQRPFSFY